MLNLLSKIVKFAIGGNLPPGGEEDFSANPDPSSTHQDILHEAYLYSEIQASGYFDEEWYATAYSGEIEVPQDLLLDYVRYGISNGREPSPYFNTIIYRRENDVTPEQALFHFLNSNQQVASGAYRSAQALLAAQQNYRNNTTTQLIEDRRVEPKPFAVFLQCGSGALLQDWWQDKDQPWHLIINHYDHTYRGMLPYDVEFRQAGKLPGTKFTSVYSILTQYPNILEPYDYILLMDDDVVFEDKDITRLFYIVEHQGWEMAQASLSTDSHCSYDVFYYSGKPGWRLVNGVEIMMPVFSSRILSTVKELIGQSISGWGFDSSLSMVAKREGYRAAVIDDVVARHNKPINAHTGKYYQMLHQAQIYPELEFTHLQKKYGFTKPLFYEVPSTPQEV